MTKNMYCFYQVVVCVSAGYRHSACVTAEGQLFTWGEGDYGRLGLGDNTSRNTPVLVKEISNAGSVSLDCLFFFFFE